MQTHKISEVMIPDAMQYGVGTRCDKEFILNVITWYKHAHSFILYFRKNKKIILREENLEEKIQFFSFLLLKFRSI